MSVQAELPSQNSQVYHKWVRDVIRVIDPLSLGGDKSARRVTKSTHKLPLTLNSVIWCSSENGRRWADPMACHMDPVDGSLSEHHVGLIYLLQCTDTAQEVLSPWPLQSTLPLQSLSLWARCSWSHWGISCSRCTKNAACKHAGQDAAGQWGTAVGAGGSSETQLQAVTTISVFVIMSY